DVNSGGSIINDIVQTDASYDGGDQRWITRRDFDSAGRVLKIYQPSACVSYNASTHSVTVESSTGLVRIFTYDGNGLTARKLSKGSTGTQYWLEKLGYTSESLGDHEERKLLASRTVFREENTTGTGGETTTFDYTFHSGTLEIETLETTYPVVGSSENGPGGTALTRGRTFNTSGQLVWARDENGSITYLEYDEKL